MGGRGRALLCSSRTAQVQCVGIEQDIAQQAMEIPHLDLFQAQERGLSFQTTWGTSPTEAEADKDILKVPF